MRTLWDDDTLYVLAEVTDATPDVSGSDPWVQDSLEIFLDGGNFKNGPYRFDDTQIRINSRTSMSFGTGDVAFQEARLESATAPTDDGYVVEASISLLEYGGAGNVPRARLPGQRRHQRRPHLDPHVGRPDRPRLPEHGPLGRRRSSSRPMRGRGSPM